MFDKAMRKSIETYMQPGEELLEVAIVQGKGMTKFLAMGGAAGQAIAGARRDRRPPRPARAATSSSPTRWASASRRSGS